MKSLSLSIIITTYNWPEALRICLNALAPQLTTNMEVIIADDGSKELTRKLIARYQQKWDIPLKHIWQEDSGFRAAKIRNKAIMAASNDYILFLDGDCVAPCHFLSHHLQLAKRKHFVAGNRVLLNKTFTEEVLSKQLPLQTYSIATWWGLYRAQKMNRLLPLVSLPLGPLRHLKANRWQGAKTCNLAVFKDDLLAVNGFDESYEGWGFEDSDLVIRLQQHGIMRIDGRYKVPVIHLWHPERSREEVEANFNKLLQTQKFKKRKVILGLNQYGQT